MRKKRVTLSVVVNDGVNETSKDILVSVNHLNDELPFITDATLSSNINENTPIDTVIIDADHTDLDINETQTFSYVLGGTDLGQFNFDSSTGKVTFKTTPDYENPVDSDRNNLYELTIRANDGENLGPVSKLGVRLNNLDDVPAPIVFNGIVRGTVNYGQIVANALVLLQDSNGNFLQVFTDAYGNYRFTLGSSFTGPFLVKSFLPTGEILYSYNDGKHEVTNITPITTLMVSNFLVELGISTKTLDEFFTDYTGFYTTYSGVFATKFTKAYTTIAAYFSSHLVTAKLSNFNHIYNTFYSFGFDYDTLLAEANMIVANGTIIIRYRDSVYSSLSGDYSGNISVTGKVLGANGGNISNATVVVTYNGSSYSATTNASGVYTLSIPKYIKYNLAITYNSKTVNYYDLSTFLDANNTSQTQLSLENAQFAEPGNSTISGKILNVSNTALKVAGATVKVREGYNNQTSSVLKTATTNSNGEFTLELENGNYTFEFSKASWTTKYVTVYVNSTKTIADTEIGLISDVSGISTIEVDLLASSDSGISDSDNITNDTTPTIVSDQDVTLLVKDAAFSTVQEIIMTQTNSLSVTLSALSDGKYTIVGVDSQGNATGFTLLSFMIDTTTVATPTINLHSTTDSGALNNDDITNARSIRLTGNAEANSTLQIKENGVKIFDISVGSDGDYSKYVNDFAEGEHNLTAYSTDIAGNFKVSTILHLVVDRTGSPITNIDLNASSDTGRSSTDNYTNDTTPTFTTDQNVTLDVRDNTGAILQSINCSYLNNYTVTLNTLSDGSYSITSGDKNNNNDVAGNKLNYSYSYFTIDTTTHAIVLDLIDDTGKSNTDNITNSTRIRIYTNSEYYSTVTLYNGLDLLGSSSGYGSSSGWLSLNNLLDGNFTLTATVEDRAGNTNTEVNSLEIEIDRVGIEASTIDLNASSDSGYSNLDNITNDTTPTFTTSKNVMLRAVKDSVIVQEINTTLLASGVYTATFATLADGIYTVESGINDTDIAGNSLGYSSLTLNIDTTITMPTIDLEVASDSGVSDSDNITNDNTPTITGSSDNYSKLVIKDVLVELEVINANYSSYDPRYGTRKFTNGAYNTVLSELSDGNHTINVTAVDKAGNSVTTSLEIEIDTLGVPSVEMDIEGSEIDTVAIIDGISAKLDLLEKKHSLSYRDLTPSYWKTAGNDMYRNGNYLYVDGILQELWETTNTSDRNATNFGNYTFRTNPSSTVLFVENFQGSEFKITGEVGRYGSRVAYGELDSVNGLKAYYRQVYSTNNYYPTVNHIILTNAKKPTFTPVTSSSRKDEFTLSNIEEGANLIYILFARKNTYDDSPKNYSKAELQEIVNNLEVVANATNDSTPAIITDINATIKVIDDNNNTLETLTTTANSGIYSATFSNLTDGNYSATVGEKGTDTAGNLLSYSVMNFIVDTVISNPSLDLNASSDSGVSDSDNITNQTTLTLQGVAEARVKVEIKDAQNTLLATGYTNTDGNYTIELSDLADANYTLSVVSTDAAGNSKTQNLEVQVDTFGDTLIDISMATSSDNGNSNSDQITSMTTPTINTDRSSTLTIVNSDTNTTVQTVNTASNSVTLATLSDGIYTVEGGDKGTDTAGNALSFNTTTIQIDTSAPVLTSPTELDRNSTITSNSLHVYNTATSDASDVTYTLGGTDAGYFTIDSITGIITLADITNSGSTYSVSVTASDAVGNSATYSITITPQVVAPLNVAKLNIANASAIAVFGNYLVVGDSSDDTVASNAGATYVYKREDDGSLLLLTKLTASNATSSDYFGQSVAINGNHIVIGAYGINCAYLYTINADGTFTEASILNATDGLDGNFGLSVDIDENYIVIGANAKYGTNSYEGAAHLYKINSDNTTTEIVKLVASDAEYSDYFGFSVSISGDKVVVGAYNEDEKGSNAGAAYVYKINSDDTATELSKITSSDGATNDNFGYSVSIDGNKIIIGAHQNDPIKYAYNAGAAYLYNIENDETIKELAKLTASDLTNNFDYDYFGKSVSIDGEYIAIGSEGNSHGATYLYKIDNENSVTELTKLTSSDNSTSVTFGKIVAVNNGNIAINSNNSVYLYDIFANKPYIPALDKSIIFYESSKTDIYTIPFTTNVDSSEISFTLSGDDADKFTVSDSIIHSTSALDFETPSDANIDNNYSMTLTLQDLESRVNSYDLVISVKDTIYFQNTKLKANDAESNDKLGSSIATDGEYIISGAPYEDANAESDAGSAYLFKKNADDTTTQVSKLTASDASRYNHFGESVAIDSNYIVVGADKAYGLVDSTGAAYLFKVNSGGTTTQVAKLMANDGQNQDMFGASVSISGNYIVVGAYGDDDNGSGAGSLYLFKKDSSDNITQLAKLTGSDIDRGDAFGYSVSINGNTIISGAYGKGYDAKIYLFEIDTEDAVSEVSTFTTADSKSRFGYSLDMDGDYIIIGNHGYNNAYLFKKGSDNNVTQVAKLTVGTTASTTYSVSIDSTTIAIGDNRQRSVSIFNIDSSDNVEQIAKITSSNQYFGHSVDIFNTNIVTGDYGDDTIASDSGSVYLYVKDSNQAE